MPHLTTDIYSTRRELYGKKDEPVTIVAIHGDVLIVQGKRGRFAVDKSKVKE